VTRTTYPRVRFVFTSDIYAAYMMMMMMMMSAWFATDRVISVYIILLCRNKTRVRRMYLYNLRIYYYYYYCCCYYINAVCKSIKSKAERPLLASGEYSSKSENETLVAHKHKYIYIRVTKSVLNTKRDCSGGLFFIYFFTYLYKYSPAPYIIIKSVNPRTLPWSRRDVN